MVVFLRGLVVWSRAALLGIVMVFVVTLFLHSDVEQRNEIELQLGP